MKRDMDGTKSEATLKSKDGTSLPADVVKAIHLSLQFLLARKEHTASYLEPGSVEEREARTALAWLLREHLARTAGAHALGAICRLLADLFDAQSGETRELRLRYKPQAKATWRARKIAGDVADMIAAGRGVDAAIQRASELHAVTRATGYRAWEDHGADAIEFRRFTEMLRLKRGS